MSTAIEVVLERIKSKQARVGIIGLGYGSCMRLLVDTRNAVKAPGPNVFRL